MVFAVAIAEPVEHPPVALAGFVALQHAQIAGIIVVDQRFKVFFVGVFVPDCFRPRLLMIGKLCHDGVIGERACTSQRFVHLLNLAPIGVADVAPQHGILSVEHVGIVYLVGIFEIVFEVKLAFVVTSCYFYDLFTIGGNGSSLRCLYT